jgi:hypothetical protein
MDGDGRESDQEQYDYFWKRTDFENKLKDFVARASKIPELTKTAIELMEEWEEHFE